MAFKKSAVKKAVIMAAGKGTRMLPLTENMPKHLIKVAGKPFLAHILDRLKAAGFTDVGIIVGYKAEMIEEFLKNSEYNAHLIHQPEPQGTGQALILARTFTDQSPFVAMGGDNLWSEADLASIGKDDGFCYISAIEVDNPSKFGVLEVSGGFLKRIHEKPEVPPGNLINTGLYKFTSDIYDELEQIKPSERGELELTDAITSLAAQKKVKVEVVKDYWLDLGCLDDLPKVSAFLENLKIEKTK